jgi:hypothetical protein
MSESSAKDPNPNPNLNPNPNPNPVLDAIKKKIIDMLLFKYAPGEYVSVDIVPIKPDNDSNVINYTMHPDWVNVYENTGKALSKKNQFNDKAKVDDVVADLIGLIERASVDMVSGDNMRALRVIVSYANFTFYINKIELIDLPEQKLDGFVLASATVPVTATLSADETVLPPPVPTEEEQRKAEEENAKIAAAAAAAAAAAEELDRQRIAELERQRKEKVAADAAARVAADAEAKAKADAEAKAKADAEALERQRKEKAAVDEAARVAAEAEANAKAAAEAKAKIAAEALEIAAAAKNAAAIEAARVAVEKAAADRAAADRAAADRAAADRAAVEKAAVEKAAADRAAADRAAAVERQRKADADTMRFQANTTELLKKTRLAAAAAEKKRVDDEAAAAEKKRVDDEAAAETARLANEAAAAKLTATSLAIDLGDPDSDDPEEESTPESTEPTAPTAEEATEVDKIAKLNIIKVNLLNIVNKAESDVATHANKSKEVRRTDLLTRHNINDNINQITANRKALIEMHLQDDNLNKIITNLDALINLLTPPTRGLVIYDIDQKNQILNYSSGLNKLIDEYLYPNSTEFSFDDLLQHNAAVERALAASKISEEIGTKIWKKIRDIKLAENATVAEKKNILNGNQLAVATDQSLSAIVSWCEVLLGYYDELRDLINKHIHIILDQSAKNNIAIILAALTNFTKGIGSVTKIEDVDKLRDESETRLNQLREYFGIADKLNPRKPDLLHSGVHNQDTSRLQPAVDTILHLPLPPPPVQEAKSVTPRTKPATSTAVAPLYEKPTYTDPTFTSQMRKNAREADIAENRKKITGSSRFHVKGGGGNSTKKKSKKSSRTKRHTKRAMSKKPQPKTRNKRDKRGRNQTRKK